MLKLFTILMISIIAVTACNDQSNTPVADEVADSSKNQPVSADTTTMPVYDAATDGMLVAPGITRKLGDTLGIKMYEVTAKPGDSIPLHAHPDHTFYVIDGGKAAIYFGNDRQEWELKPGMGFVNGPVKDAAKNIGKTNIKFLVVDIYRPRSK